MKFPRVDDFIILARATGYTDSSHLLAWAHSYFALWLEKNTTKVGAYSASDRLMIQFFGIEERDTYHMERLTFQIAKHLREGGMIKFEKRKSEFEETMHAEIKVFK